MANDDNNDRKLYTVMLTGEQLTLVSHALMAYEQACFARADRDQLMEGFGATFMHVSDVLEEMYADRGITD